MFKRLRDIFRQKKGVAMILTICVMLLLFALGTAMLVAASSTLGSVDVNLRSEQARLNAYSYGKLLESQLIAPAATQGNIPAFTTPLKEQVDKIADGGSLTLKSDITDNDGANWGSAQCVLTRSGNKLTAEIKGEFVGTVYTLELVLRRSAAMTGEAERVTWLRPKYYPEIIRQEKKDENP